MSHEIATGGRHLSTAKLVLLFSSPLGARTLLGARGLTTRSKKLLGTKGIATRSKDAIRLEAIAICYKALGVEMSGAKCSPFPSEEQTYFFKD